MVMPSINSLTHSGNRKSILRKNPYPPTPIAKKNLKNTSIISLNNNLDDEDSSIMSSVSEISLANPLDKPILATLDFLSLMVFAAIGKASHSADGSLDLAAVFTTAFPFLISWFVTSPLTGVYSIDDKDENELLDAIKVAAKGWIVAIPLGCIGRGLIKGYVPPLPFVIVTMISTLIILSTVRVLYTVVEGKLTQT